MFQYFTHAWPDRVLFDSWTVRNWTDYTFYCFLSFCLGFGHELLKVSLSRSRLKRRLKGLGRSILATWGFINMLLAMTFNIGLFWSLLIGHGFAVAWDPPTSVPSKTWSTRRTR